MSVLAPFDRASAAAAATAAAAAAASASSASSASASSPSTASASTETGTVTVPETVPSAAHVAMWRAGYGLAPFRDTHPPAPQPPPPKTRRTIDHNADDSLEVEWYLPGSWWGRANEVVDRDHEVFYSVWEKARAKYHDLACLGMRSVICDAATSDTGKTKYGEYKWQSYADVGTIADKVGSSLATTMHAQKGENIGLYSNNRAEWMISDIAIHRQGMTSVPLYSTFGKESVIFVVGHAEIKVMLCSGDVVPLLIADISSMTTLKHIVSFDQITLSPEQQKELKSRGVQLHFWSEIEESSPDAVVAPTPSTSPVDIFSIVYTSGTTGDPKGVVLTDQAALSAAESPSQGVHFDGGFVGEVHYSYLPLAHVYEREFVLALITAGGSIGFATCLPNMLEDLAKLRPTYLLGVPRVWKRMYDKINDKISQMGFIKRTLFNTALNSKIAAIKSGTKTWVDWDSLVFNKMKEMLGGRVRFAVSGAAPLDSELHPWMEAVFCMDVLQGYGLTESFGSVCSQCTSMPSPYGYIGSLMPLSNYRLVDVPEMGYFHTDNPPKGEIYLKGDTMFSGYYKNPELTASVMTPDGWFATGDIAELGPYNNLKIIDRKKNIFKLSQGEYIAAEKLENVYGRTRGVAQVWIHGESGDSFIVAVVVPDSESFPKIVKEALKLQDEDVADFAKLCALPEVEKFLLAQLTALGKASNLAGFEIIKGIVVEPEPFTSENNLATVNMKLKRVALKLKYKAVLDALRERISATIAPAAKTGQTF
eukprot:TRINITY_DN1966_c0_g1_i1.p1 TRINITY_DN1966_c0_g1~~TRINITY_DN1966_c0_g1_i1.p1  ORF type:complete len:763 (+),score=214.16 TRINITY_DN1966_c0_g1_i1:2-2290(+)